MAEQNFREWFNPRNLTHMEAYVHVSEKGYWPEGFIPEDMDMLNWHLFAMANITEMAIQDFKVKRGNQS